MEDTKWAVMPSGCWEWQGHLIAGYGSVCVKNKRMKAHRAMYELHHGPIPEGLVIDHLCRNRSCVNPDHLEAVTVAENTRRGRAAKLNEDGVAVIRRKFKEGQTLKTLAKEFGLSMATVGLVVTGVTWGNVHVDLISRDNRHRFGLPRRKLSDVEVAQLKSFRESTGCSFVELGLKFGVSDEQARRICHGLRRQNVTGGKQ